MENQMFCFQCQETAKGTGCTVRGVCGKLPETSRWQDLLISVVRGLGTIGHALNEAGVSYELQMRTLMMMHFLAGLTRHLP